VGKLAGLILVAMAAAMLVSGCGGGSESQLEKVEAEYKEVRAEVEAVDKKAEKASDEYFEASEVTGKLLEQQLNAISAGNMAKYHELQAATKAAEANSQQLYKESQSQPYASKKLEAREEALASEIESLKGCDKSCQQERDRAVALNSHCAIAMAKAEISFKQATEICDRRFPIPHENILHLAGEDE